MGGAVVGIDLDAALSTVRALGGREPGPEVAECLIAIERGIVAGAAGATPSAGSSGEE